MADKQLFPVFEMPSVDIVKQSEEQKYKSSVYFDFNTGDFKQDGAHKLIPANGREAYRQWCIKIVLTERYDHLAYSMDIGTELNEAMQEPEISAIKSALERTITEALMVNKHTEYVRDFTFSREADCMRLSFTVKGYDLEEQQINLTIPV